MSRSSLDIPGGSVKTGGGEILVRTKGQKYRGPEFEKIIVRTRNDGTRVRLGDIATVHDAFEDVVSRYRALGMDECVLVYPLNDAQLPVFQQIARDVIPEYQKGG